MSVEYALRSHRVLEGQAMQDGYRIYRHPELTDVLVVVLDTSDDVDPDYSLGNTK